MMKSLPLLLIVLLAGCAQPASPAGSSAGSPSAPVTTSTALGVPPRGPTGTAIPLLTVTPPSEPPSKPTDNLNRKNTVVGTVLRGGTGPCYGVVADDGTNYAVYQDEARELTKGTRVVVRTTPSKLRIDCGEGRFVQALSIEPLR